MLPLLFGLATAALRAPGIDALSGMAAKRDVADLDKLLVPSQQKSPFGVLNGGAYGVGQYGWSAVELNTVDGRRLVVFTTLISSEDTGDLVFEREGDRLRYLPEDDDMGVRVKNHDFDLTFDVPHKMAKLTDVVSFRRSDKSGKAFLARFSSQYKVLSVTEDGRPKPFAQAGGVVSLPTPEGKGDFVYRLQYEAVVDLPNYAGSISPSEATLTNDYWYPMIARQPATYSIAIHSPKGWTAVAQGEPISLSESATERVTKYRMDMPVTYYSVSAAPYKMHEEDIHGIRYTIWSLHMGDQQMADQCRLFAGIIEFYELGFGKYPFSGFGAVVSDVYGSGALEAYSFATYSYMPADDAHEPAHTWWGGMVGNSYLHSLWNESFAVYCDGLYHREGHFGNVAAREEAFKDRMDGPQTDWDQGTVEGTGAMEGQIAGTLAYGKGAMVLSMLEQEIGQGPQVKAMQNWLVDQPKDRTGEWQDFEAEVDKATGQNYGWFFDQWLRRTGVPDFDVSGVAYHDGYVTGAVKFKSKPYKMKCEVLLAEGSQAEFQTFLIDGDGPFSIPAKAKPTLVSFDPWVSLLRNVRGDERTPSLIAFPRDRVYRDPNSPNARLEYRGTLDALPKDLGGVVIVGSPETLPAMAPLCAQAGFKVEGDKLTYGETTIDLTQGTASALVDVGGGKYCLIALGSSRLRPEFGHSTTCLSDVLGRFLDGETPMKTSGFLTYKLDP